MDAGIAEIFKQVSDADRARTSSLGRSQSTVQSPGDVLEVRILSLEPASPTGQTLPHTGVISTAISQGKRVDDLVDRPNAHDCAGGIRIRAGRRLRSRTCPEPSSDPASVARKPNVMKVKVPLRPHLGRWVWHPPSRPAFERAARSARRKYRQLALAPGTDDVLPVTETWCIAITRRPTSFSGDGEISGTALEASLQRDYPSSRSQRPYLLMSPCSKHLHTGMSMDLATRSTTRCGDAARAMLRFLNVMWAIGADDAYSLLSVGGELHRYPGRGPRQAFTAGISKSIIGISIDHTIET